MIEKLRYGLAPLSVVYAAVLKARHKLFDMGIIKSAEFNFPVICVGNLALGGTGKSPMVEYLVNFLSTDYKVATLSRGYKRKTKGYVLANENTSALDIGDEPMQFHQKFPDVAVAVGEERVSAIPQLLYDRPDTEVIILDDAFQHRYVKAGLNILLTECGNLYSSDLLVPAGNLRDVQSSSKRSDMIVVTKCRRGMTIKEREKVIKELDPLPSQSVYFTEIAYGTPYHLFSGEDFLLSKDVDVLLLCGIANPKPLIEYLEENVKSLQVLEYSDHKIFDSDDLKKIQKQFEKNTGKMKIILTTEKDAMRLHKFEAQLAHYPVFSLPVKHQFLFNEGADFEQKVKNFVTKYKNKPQSVEPGL